MWNISNEQNALFIQTGNMSEKATGYTTVGGDQMGGFSLIGNLPKTVVIALLEFLRDSLHSSLCLPPGARTVLEKLMRTKASAELAKNQYDEEDLMPFEVLDAGMHLAFENKMDREEIEIVLTQMFPEHESQMRGWVEKLVRLFKNSVFKWAFLPPGVHLGRLDLSLEGAQRTAIACSNEWQDQ